MTDSPRSAAGDVPPQRPEQVAWPCRYCQSRGTVVVTWRDALVSVCFCTACEQGWRATDRGQPTD